MLLALLACAPDAPAPLEQRRLHQGALALLPSDPQGAAAICPQIQDLELRADCAWATVVELAPRDDQAAGALCMQLKLDTLGHECWFLVGEHSGKPAACSNAGPMADDCRMHVLSRRLWDRFPADTLPGLADEDALMHIVGAGLAPGDERAWSAWYRQLLTRNEPLDPGLCLAVGDPARQEICRRTVRPVFNDRLNRGRDQGEELCEAEPTWVLLDQALAQELKARRQQDLCDPDAVQALPE
mgnify:CR=1 FL=1